MEIDQTNDQASQEQANQEQAMMQEYNDLVVEKQNEKSGNVTKNDFEMISIIGKGSYGKVSLVKKKDTGQLYALKVLKKSEIVRRN